VTSKYDVDFPMFSKIEVNGAGACELYRLLKAAQPGDEGLEAGRVHELQLPQVHHHFFDLMLVQLLFQLPHHQVELGQRSNVCVALQHQ